MVKNVLVCIALLAVSNAAPQDQYNQQEKQPEQPEPHDHPVVQILKQDSVQTVDGYHFEFETSDGTAREEQGEIKDPGTDHEALSIKGSYRYISPEGQHYAVTFIADENGFQPSSHLDADAGRSSSRQEYTSSQAPNSLAPGGQPSEYQPQDPSSQFPPGSPALGSQTPTNQSFDYQPENQSTP